jgi:hypothetical protein
MDFFKSEDCEFTKNTGRIGQPILSIDFISLAKANSLLRERAKVVYTDDDKIPAWTDRQQEQYTKRALLICVEEIEKTTSESLLKKLIKASNDMNVSNLKLGIIAADIADEAKRLLERKGD